jgi:hypothetical protein
MQFLLILLLLFATGCRPAELVDAKKKQRKRTPGLNDNKTCTDTTDDEGFNDTEGGADTDFGFDSDNAHNSTVTDLGSEIGNNGSDNNNIAISDNQTEYRQFDTLYYKDVRLLVVRNPVAGERNVLAIEVKLAYYKGAKRKPKP